MKYENMVEGKFLARPNRFIAHIEIAGKTEICHVKNTGRCGELLTTGATVFCQRADKPNRKTKYDLIAVKKTIGSSIWIRKPPTLPLVRG